MTGARKLGEKLTANASGLTPFSIKDTQYDSDWRSNWVFWWACQWLVLELAAEATRTRRIDISCRISIVSRAAFLLSSTAGFEAGAGGILIVFIGSDSGVDLDGLGAVVCGCCLCWLGVLAVAKEQCITFQNHITWTNMMMCDHKESITSWYLS